MDTSPASTTNLVIVEVDGASYTINLPFADSDYIQGFIKSTAEPYELEMLRAMSATLGSNDLVLDVGANIGNHSLYLAAVSGARVIAYEPDSRLTKALSRSVDANGLENKITVRSVALADSRGELVLVDDVDGNLGNQHVVSDPDAEGLRVPAVRLDDEMPEHAVSAVKIDVEGYETNVLDGAQNLLERDRPDLWIECLDADHYRQIFKRIAPCGYRINGVFNASPTYHFVHDPEPNLDSFNEAVNSVVERFYADHTSFIKTRELLLAANAKYRTVTQQYGELRDRLFEEAGPVPQAGNSSLIALRHAENKSLELQDRIEELLTEKHRSDKLHFEVAARLTSNVREIKSDRDRATRASRMREIRLKRKTRAEIAAATRRIKGLSAQLDALRAQCEKLALEAVQATECSDDLRKRLNERDEAIARLKHRHLQYREDFDVLRDYVMHSGISLETLEETVENQADEIKDLRKRLTDSYSVGRTLRERVAEVEKLSRRLTRARDFQRSEAEARTAELQVITAQHREIQQNLAEQESLSRRLARARDTQRSEAEARKVELRSLATQYERAQQELTELSPLPQVVAGHEAEIARLASELELRDRTVDEQEATLAKARSQLDALVSSRTYRAGEAWRDASTWNGFWALIPTLLRIAHERKS